MGVGLGVISGSILKTLVAIQNNQNGLQPKSFNVNSIAINKLNKLIRLKKPFPTEQYFPENLTSSKKELIELSTTWRNLANEQKGLEASAFLYLIDQGSYAKLSPNKALPAASTIKIPILLVVLEMIDSGKISWNEKLKINKEALGGGAGWMAYQPIGKVFPVHEVTTEMIRISDNTATNLLIQRIGGKEIINQRFQELGLQNTQIKNYLPDLKGTNTTSTQDLSRVFAIVDSGKALSQRSRDLFRETMSTSVTNSLLPEGILKGLGSSSGNTDYKLQIKGYKVFNKTGDIGIAYGDAALIQMPDTSRAVAGFLVKGPFNDPRSTELIRDMAAAMSKILQPQSSKTR